MNTKWIFNWGKAQATDFYEDGIKKLINLELSQNEDK